ncbi:hypothetical protein [Pedobacter sp. BMA]|uniref:hypothetical protein n=1 Tax=Pedobacter sp. BMA TaxID=1663685 RepID=UPI000A4C9F16|nr:hypothetical protein [Pedobacter sp. BMA]
MITICDNAKQTFTYFPTRARKFHYNFPDPAKATGTDEEVMEQFSEAREVIRKYTQNFVNENFKS